VTDVLDTWSLPEPWMAWHLDDSKEDSAWWMVVDSRAPWSLWRVALCEEGIGNASGPLCHEFPELIEIIRARNTAARTPTTETSTK
jgi:hypothetical protein